MPYMDLNQTLEYEEDPNNEHDIYNALFPTDVFMQHGWPVEPMEEVTQQSDVANTLQDDASHQAPSANGSQEQRDTASAPAALMSTAQPIDQENALNTSFDPFLDESSHLSINLGTDDVGNILSLAGHDDLVGSAEEDNILNQFDFGNDFNV